jgi:hypothetical protein
MPGMAKNVRIGTRTESARVAAITGTGFIGIIFLDILDTLSFRVGGDGEIGEGIERCWIPEDLDDVADCDMIDETIDVESKELLR